MYLKKYIKQVLIFIFRGVPVKNVSASISYLNPNNRLSGKKIIITGGGRGLGYAMAKKFAAEGASVLIAGRNEETLKKAASEIGCQYLSLDVSKPNTFGSFMEQANQILGGVNCVVNNAGISLHEQTFFDVTPETFDKQVDTNLKGGFFLTQEFIKVLKKDQRTGTVLFTSSETGDTMDFRPYGFTKSAVNSMVQGLAYLFSKDGIRVNAIAPGITTSDMTGFKADGNLYEPRSAIERVYLPEEVAETASFLLSDAAGCISGQIITCNNAKTVNARWK